MDDTRESRQRLDTAFQEARGSERVRAVMAEYTRGIYTLHGIAEALWQLGEIRFSAAIESRVIDLELQARRHIDSIVEREREQAAEPPCEHCGKPWKFTPLCPECEELVCTECGYIVCCCEKGGGDAK